MARIVLLGKIQARAAIVSAAECYGTTADELLAHKKRSHHSLGEHVKIARCAALYALIDLTQCTQTDIAPYFDRSPGQISILMRLARWMHKTDRTFRSTIPIIQAAVFEADDRDFIGMYI